MKMTNFCCSDKKANAAKTMWAPLNSVLAADGILEHLHRAKSRPIEQHRCNQQSRIEQLLGVRLDAKEAEKILQGLGLKTRRHAKRGRIEVVPPTSRADLTREADLIEELARLHGYQKIPSTLPPLKSSG